MERKYGIEQEFGTSPALPTSELNRVLDELGYDRLGEFLTNGYRAYMDVGNHLEISTPLQPDIRSAVAAYLGGHIMAQSMQGIPVEDSTVRRTEDEQGRAIVLDTVIEPLLLDTNVVDRLGNAWGLHENYDTSVNQGDDVVINTLTSVMATRLEFSSSRAVIDDDGNVVLMRSQKGHTIRQLTGISTTKDRPLMHQGRESHGGLGRLHVIICDGRMIPANTQMAMGLLAGSLTLLENGHDLSHLALEDPAVDALNVAKDDPEDRTLVTRRDGSGDRTIGHDEHIQLTAQAILDHAEEMTDEVVTLAEATYAAMDEKKAAEPITQEAIADGQRHPLVDTIDAIAKKELLVQMNNRGSSPSKIVLALMDRWATMDVDANLVYRRRHATGGYSADILGSLELAQGSMADGTHPQEKQTDMRANFIGAVNNAPESIRELTHPSTDWSKKSYTKIGLGPIHQREIKESY